MDRAVLQADQAVGIAACVGLGAWFVASVVSQHPQRVFDRMRRHEPTGIALPDWRFFAPEPAQHDFIVLCRTLRSDGSETAWENVVDTRPRSWSDAIWFPRRRLDKAVHDLCDQLTQQLSMLGGDGTTSPAYALLRGVVERRIRTAGPVSELPKGFQFLIARSCGYDGNEEPQYIYLSRFEKL